MSTIHVYPVKEGKTDHDVDGKECWCCPKKVTFTNGNKLIIHNRGDN